MSKSSSAPVRSTSRCSGSTASTAISGCALTTSAAAACCLLFLRGRSFETVQLPGGTIPPHDGHGPVHIAFSIAADELAAWEERLAAADIAIEGRTKWPRGGESVYFRDPDGHLLELATPGLWPGY